MLTNIEYKEVNGVVHIEYLDHEDYERTMKVPKDQLIFRIAEAYECSHEKAVEAYEVYTDTVVENFVKENHK